MSDAWLPRTEDNVQAMIDQDLTRESHIFDVKREPPKPGKNQQLAIDLASFAVHGGRILYGLAEGSPSTTQMVRSPFDLSGFAERIDQVAGSLIDKPLRVRCEPIPSDESPGLGYLLVVIPASPDAPHQVDNKYRGRGDTTNIILGDAEVSRLHETRMRREDNLQALLQEEIARDPTDGTLRTQGHLFVIAQPVGGAGDLLINSLKNDADWHTWLNGPFRQPSLAAFPETGQQPSLFQGTFIDGRPRGYAIHSFHVGADRHIRPNGDLPAREDQLLDLEIREDGGLRLFCGRASYQLQSGPMVFSALIVSLTRRVLHAAIAVSSQAQWLGSWGFGIGIQGIGRATVTRNLLRNTGERIVEDYERVHMATYDELRSDPDAIIRTLLGPFFRGLGFGDRIPEHGE